MLSRIALSSQTVTYSIGTHQLAKQCYLLVLSSGTNHRKIKRCLTACTVKMLSRITSGKLNVAHSIGSQ